MRVNCVVSFCFALLPFLAIGQKTTQSKSAYYLDISKGNGMVVHEIHTEALNIQYHDFYGKQSEVPLRLFNSKQEEVAKFLLSKQYGLNHFKIALGALYSAWSNDEIYRCQLIDERGHKHELLLRKGVLDAEEVVVNISVNPITLTCEETIGNLVDFYGSITGGKAPYVVRWYVLNNNRTEFLFQPREQVIDRPGNTMTTRIDKNPDYYVMMFVKDACGKEDQQMVHFVCDESKKKINTIFVEPLKNTPTGGTPIN
jgi:hypothetical protein